MNLNNAQRQAVEWDEGPVIVNAGPGSGKTRVVTERVIRLIERGVDPSVILAMTFTRKAAGEMTRRIHSWGAKAWVAEVRTIHSWAYRFLASHGPRYRHPAPRQWSVDELKYREVLKRVTEHNGMKWRDRDINLLESFIGLAKNHRVTPLDAEAWALNGCHLKRCAEDPRRFAEAYARAEAERREQKFLTPDDLLLEALALLEAHPEALVAPRYIMVDEYQDTSPVQVALIEKLAAPQWNLMVVGDSDQALYRFRGAEPEVVTRFPTERQAPIIELGTNYRSLPGIVTAAARLIEHNKQRLDKTLMAVRGGTATIRVCRMGTPEEEAQYIARETRDALDAGVPPEEVFVVYRMNAQSRALEASFAVARIPYVVRGAGAFYHRREVQAVLSYLRLLEDPDNTSAGRKAICTPFRYVGRELLSEIDRMVQDQSMSYVRACAALSSKSRGLHSFVEFMGMLATRYCNLGARDMVSALAHSATRIASTPDDVRDFLQDDVMGLALGSMGRADTPDIGTLIVWLEQRLRLLEYLRDQEGQETMENCRSANLAELVRVACACTTVKELLEYVDAQIAASTAHKDNDESAPAAVRLMTIHAAKGLEAHTVFLAGATQGVLPHMASLELSWLEEERRLFYVAITRAKDVLHVSSVMSMWERVDSPPSQFIREAWPSYNEEDMWSPTTVDDNGSAPSPKTRRPMAVACQCGNRWVAREEEMLLGFAVRCARCNRIVGLE